MKPVIKQNFLNCIKSLILQTPGSGSLPDFVIKTLGPTLEFSIYIRSFF